MGLRRPQLESPSAPDLAEHPVLEVDRREGLAVAEQHLGAAEEEDPVVGQREVQPLDDLGLGVPVEVHHRIAAEEEIHPRDRRVAQEVVLAEDDRAADRAIQDRLAVVELEVLAPELLGDVVELARVAGTARLLERGLVPVGAVDLDPARVLVEAELLRQEHGDGERLLSGCAAGAPDPDRAPRPADGEIRQDMSRQVVPGLAVAEEGLTLMKTESRRAFSSCGRSRRHSR